jgi:hypothetical protein
METPEHPTTGDIHMGTRGFIGFVVDGVEKITYNHYDSA